jgi:hypothetical protein
VLLYRLRKADHTFPMMPTISHRVRTAIRRIMLADAGKRQNQHKNMTNKSSEKLNTAPLSTDAPTGVTLDEVLHRDGPAMELAKVQKQVNRILDIWADRTRAILASLDLAVGEFHASWHPCGDMTGLSEKLSHVEIIPQVKANVHSQED